jgi:Mg-chelatase subunit ChlD
VSDPVELLMKVQLGGGTDIAKAMRYAQSLIQNPRRSIVVLVSDFYEGGSPHELVRLSKSMVQSGCTVLGLAALDSGAKPNYDRDMAQQLVNVGAHIGAMTPGELAAWLAEKVQQ